MSQEIKVKKIEMEGVNRIEPYAETFFPPVPTRFTRRMRVSFFWQTFRFAIINLKMIRMIRKSHH